MTEQEWLSSADPQRMLTLVERRATPRQKRLLLGACCRRLDNLIPNDACRGLIAASDRFADGECSLAELDEAHWLTDHVCPPSPAPWTRTGIWAAAENVIRGLSFKLDLTQVHEAVKVKFSAVLDGRPFEALASTYLHMMAPAQKQAKYNEWHNGITLPERQSQAELIRCIFGSPFQTVTFLPEWRTSTVLALAQQMYESRDFSAMPILADALQDAGCADESILMHCRGPEPHCRGCHVIDALLNKS